MHLSRSPPLMVSFITLLLRHASTFASVTRTPAMPRQRLPRAVMHASSSVMTKNETAAPTNARVPVLGEFPHGPTITNKDTVFDAIDEALGVSKPPDIEVILTDHMVDMNNPVSKFLHMNVLRFGHIAIRYTTSDGKQRVMNIMGDFTQPDATLINFVDPPDYFYGTDPKIAQQGGVYSRPFVGVRIENAAPRATDALHAYYEAVSRASEIGSTGEGDHSVSGATPYDVVGAPGSAKRGAARFQLVEVQFSRLARVLPAPFDKFLYDVADWIRDKDDQRRESFLATTKSINEFVRQQDETFTGGKVMEMSDDMNERVMGVRNALYQSGNCAQWTSGGLEFCGLIRRARLFPKAILIDLLEDEYLSNDRPNNVNVVYYEEVEDAPSIYPGFKCLRSAMVSPLRPIRTEVYDNMKDYANVVVRVPPGTDRAQVQKQIPSKVPQKWLQYWSLLNVYIPAGISAGLFSHIGPLGPTAAAGWLAANWWLY
mmetsp:Transcript_36406/g.90597  ORF Transcript_36406/g.90597 Transcript_36406/m.90597 type:complete len:485 (+) Transcript_36406:49-1503(+)